MEETLILALGRQGGGGGGGMEYMEEKGFYFVLSFFFYFVLLSLHIRLNSALFLDEWCCVSCLSLSLNKAGSVRKTQLPLEATKGFFFLFVCHVMRHMGS